MPINLDKFVGLAPRSSRRVPLIDTPPLGHLQALITKTLDELGPEASGIKVVERLCLKTGGWVDHAQIYGAIRRLEENDIIAQVATRPTKKRGAPEKIFKVTAAGRTAMKETLEHYVALADALQDNPPRKATRRQE